MALHAPFHLSQYYQKNGHFFTYHGNVYFGSFWDFDHFPDSVFIVSPKNRSKIIELQGKGATVELKEITDLGWEIKDFDIIQSHAEGKIGNEDEEPDLTRRGDQKWKKMFVFGAGASAFSVFNEDLETFRNAPYSPPIGNELFGKKFQAIFKKYKGVELSLASLKAFGNDVEGFFESEWTDITNSYNPSVVARHINIVFYLKELFSKISKETIDNFNDSTLYSAYINKLQKYLSKNKTEKIAFVSFNYDTILDHYLSQFFNAPLNSLTDYVKFNTNPFLLFKPHGSCNWGWRFTKAFLESNPGDISKYLYDNQTSFNELYFKHLGSPYEMIYEKSWGQELELNKNTNGKFTINKNRIEVIQNKDEQYFPSLLIPYKDKDEMVMPYYHNSVMKWYINQMEDLYLIGWKGNEDAFNTLLENQAHRLKRIFIINPVPKEVEFNLAKNLDLKKYEIIYFKDFESFSKMELE